MRELMNKRVRDTVILVVFFIICMSLSFYFSRYKLAVHPIEGNSMEPTIHDDDYALIYRTKKIKHGDIVIFNSKTYNDKLIKRVIGLGGDKIEIKYNEEIQGYEIWRNGKALKEDYIKEKITTGYEEKTICVPEGKMFFLGDNRNNSTDSHYGVLEDIDSVLGKVILRYSSINDIEFLCAFGT